MVEQVIEEYVREEHEAPTEDNPIGLTLSFDATDLREEQRLGDKNDGHRAHGGEDAGNLRELAGISDTRAVEMKFRLHVGPIESAIDSGDPYAEGDAAALHACALANREALEAAYHEQGAKVEAAHVKYLGRSGGDTHELYGMQKTWISMLRRIAELARLGFEACEKIIGLLGRAAPLSLNLRALMDLNDWARSMFQSLIVPATHYMPLLLSSSSNHISLVVGRLYFKVITNVAIFKILEKVAEVVKKTSGGVVIVAVEAFDGEHRSHFRGGGQYWARHAEEQVSSLIQGGDFASAQSALGKAQRIHVLSKRAIALEMLGPRAAPRVPGIFYVQGSVPSSAGAAPATAAGPVADAENAAETREATVEAAAGGLVAGVLP